MKKCNRCNVYVKDKGNICPLCSELLSYTAESPTPESCISMYPEIGFGADKFNLVRKIILFIAFITAVVLFIINYATYHIAPMLWSLISVAAIIYGMVTIYYSILNNSNLASKLFVQTMGASILCIIADTVLGYKGWSLNFIMPALIILSDLAIIVLIIVNPMKRRAYFMYQLTLTVFSILSFGLCFTTLMTRKELSVIAGLVCLTTLVGSILFGDKGFQNELIRRFHI